MPPHDGSAAAHRPPQLKVIAAPAAPAELRPASATDRIVEFVEEGVIEPIGRDPARWRFRAISVRRVRCAQRLEQDLGVNTAGVALALELLDELEQLRARLRRLEDFGSEG